MSQNSNEKIVKLTAEICELRQKLEEKESQLRELKKSRPELYSLTNEEIQRFSRQLILPNFGVQGQLRLKRARILIVGAGGLGCPAALHLAGIGVGEIGIVDYDDVELNNLHRQLLHTEAAIGRSKVESVQKALLALNSGVKIVPYKTQLSSVNAFEIITGYEVVLDCTDNVATRYLLNDACVMLEIPLVSGSALQYEGQLTVYNHNGGPCYRCLFPKPPPPEAVTNCGDDGVFAPVTGVIGTLQAMEAAKIVQGKPCLKGKLVLYDAVDCTFRNVKLRNRKTDCEVCGENPSVTELIDYEQFCGMKATDKDSGLNILAANERITVQSLQKILETDYSSIVDVRSESEYEICNLATINIPLKFIQDEPESVKETLESKKEIICICRRGNDSQLAVKKIKKLLPDAVVKDVIGGLHAWTREIDSDFPIY